jgi:hypothetical protein
LNKEQAESILPKNKHPWEYQSSESGEYSGFAGFFKDRTDADKFIQGLQKKS